MRKIYTIGATTYDIIFKNENPVESKVGGSQLNTSVSLGRLELPVTFISRIGNDKIGNISMKFLQQNNIETSTISRYNGNSRVALAFLDEQNNAEYNFFTPPIEMPPIDFHEINKGDIILFGSSYALREDVHEYLIPFLKKARELQAVIIYDPNIRVSHIKEYDRIKPIVTENFKNATIIKGSDVDFKRFFNTDNAEEAYKELKKINQTFDFIYTANKHDIQVYSGNFIKNYPVPPVNTVSTIGAGDNFTAGIIYSIYRMNSIKEADDWDQIIKNAVEFAQHVCSHFDNYLNTNWAKQFILNNPHQR